eukprot:8954159-Ditylum_brightwellii.AAC.1
MSIISDAFCAMLNSQQKETESLQDCTRRFKLSVDILMAHLGGPIALPKYVKNMQGYNASDADKVAELHAEASERLCGFIYMENLDQAKYGSTPKKLSQQQSLGNNQYPKMI